MRVCETKQIIEFPETIEDGAKIFYGSPYKIERRECDLRITWFGHFTNWEFTDRWRILEKGKFVDCDMPYYEREYQKHLRINKINKILDE